MLKRRPTNTSVVGKTESLHVLHTNLHSRIPILMCKHHHCNCSTPWSPWLRISGKGTSTPVMAPQPCYPPNVIGWWHSTNIVGKLSPWLSTLIPSLSNDTQGVPRNRGQPMLKMTVLRWSIWWSASQCVVRWTVRWVVVVPKEQTIGTCQQCWYASPELVPIPSNEIWRGRWVWTTSNQILYEGFLESYFWWELPKRSEISLRPRRHSHFQEKPLESEIARRTVRWVVVEKKNQEIVTCQHCWVDARRNWIGAKRHLEKAGEHHRDSFRYCSINLEATMSADNIQSDPLWRICGKQLFMGAQKKNRT